MVKYLNRAVAVDSCYRKGAFSANLSEWVDLYDLEDLAGWNTKPRIGKIQSVDFLVSNRRKTHFSYFDSKTKIQRFKNPERFRSTTVKTNKFPYLKIELDR